MEFNNLTSIFIYIIIIAGCIVIALIGSRSRSGITPVIITVTLIVFAGLRTQNVGIDNELYYNNHLYNTLLYGAKITSSWYGTYYVYLMEMLYKLGSWNLFTLVISAMTYSLIIARLWELRHVSSFPVSLTAFLCLYFPMSLNISRQFLAVAIVFFGSRFFFNRHYISYMAFLFVAILIHRISILGFGFFLFLPLYSKDLSYALRTIITLVSLAIPFVAFVLVAYLFNNYAGYYLSHIKVDLGFGVLVKIIYLMLIYILSRQHREQIDANISNKCFFYTAVAGIAISFVGYIFPNIDRIALYYLMYEPVIYGQLIMSHDKSITLLTTLFVTVVSLYSLLSTLLINSQGIVPYAFCMPSQLM